MSSAIQSCNPINRSKQAGLKTNQVMERKTLSHIMALYSYYSSIWLPFWCSQKPLQKYLDALRRAALETS